MRQDATTRECCSGIVAGKITTTHCQPGPQKYIVTKRNFEHPPRKRFENVPPSMKQGRLFEKYLVLLIMLVLATIPLTCQASPGVAIGCNFACLMA